MDLNDNGVGKVTFITEKELEDIINNDSVSLDLLNKCKEYTTSYDGSYIEIKNEKNIEDLMSVSGYFHDAHVKNIQKNNYGELIVEFDGVWGCQIEMVFSNDVRYYGDISLDIGKNVWWIEGSMFYDEDNNLVLADGSGFKTSMDVYKGIWLKAKNVKYKIIPE